MRLGYDSVEPGAIPVTAPVVLGYTAPSRYAWSAQDWQRFPASNHVEITPNASYPADVLDVEFGDATPNQAPAWVLMMRKQAGYWSPVVYCNYSTWQAVQDAFNLAGVPHPGYWIAEYPGGGQILPTLNGITAVAHQYADPNTSGGHYDLSVIADGVWESMMSDFNTTFTATTADGQTITVTYGEALENLYLETFFGSKYSPWTGSSLVQQINELTADITQLRAQLTAIQTAIAALPTGHLSGTATINLSESA